MTDFTPEHYLTAARMCERSLGFNEEWTLEEFGVSLRHDKTVVRDFDPGGLDYRALRESLDKRGLMLHWLKDEQQWSFCVWSEWGYSAYLESQIEYIVADEPVEAMMLAVVALVEAGVVE